MCSWGTIASLFTSSGPVCGRPQALREDVLAVCDSKAIIAKFEGLTVPAEALELTATAADTLTRLLSSLACIS